MCGAKAIASLILEAVRSCEITVSIGVGSLTGLPLLEFNLLLDLTDQCLYQAKAQGRNCIFYVSEV
jgi:PleD family two-component response regulator